MHQNNNNNNLLLSACQRSGKKSDAVLPTRPHTPSTAIGKFTFIPAWKYFTKIM